MRNKTWEKASWRTVVHHQWFMGCDTVSYKDYDDFLKRWLRIPSISCCFFPKPLVFLSWSILTTSISSCCFVLRSSISCIYAVSRAFGFSANVAFASFVYVACVAIFASSSRMHCSEDELCDETPKLECNVAEGLFSSIICMSGTCGKTSCRHALFVVCIMIESVVRALLVHYTMMAHTIILRPRYYKLLMGATIAICLLLESFSMLWEFLKNSKLDAPFMLFFALWNKDTHISTAYQVIIINIQDFNNLFKFLP